MSRYSASQLTTFKACPMKWVLTYLMGHRSPPTPSQEFGTRVHAELEAYYKEGTTPTLDVARRMCIPIHEPAEIEVGFEHPVCDSLMIGYIDVCDRPGSWRVVDHKTTSSLQHALEEYELRTNVQMMVYAHVLLSRIEDDAVIIAHNVGCTKGSGHRYTETVVTREHVAEQWAKIEALVQEAEALRAVGGQGAEKRGETNGECDKYGGCPVRGVCVTTSLVGIGMAKEDKVAQADALAKLKAKLESAKKTKPAEAEAQTTHESEDNNYIVTVEAKPPVSLEDRVTDLEAYIGRLKAAGRE